MKKIENQKGSLMIESMVAISLVVVSLLGVLSLLTRAIGFNQLSYHRFIAAGLAAEGIEIVKNHLDIQSVKNKNTNGYWNIDPGFYQVRYDCNFSNNLKNCSLSKNGSTFFYNLNTPLDNVLKEADFLDIHSTNGFYNYYSTYNYSPTVFKRVVRVENISNPEIQIIRVNSYVQWNTRGKTSTINVEDHFYNWRQKK